MEQPIGTINGTQAYIIECNRANSDIDANAPDDQNAKWTTKTDFQLKRGDRVSVEAIMIESVGASNAAQTIEFDGELIKDGRDFKSYVDNKVIFEFGFYINNNAQRSIQLPLAMPNNFMNRVMDGQTNADILIIGSNNQGFHKPNTIPVNNGGWILESNLAGGGWAKDDPIPNPDPGTPLNVLNNTLGGGVGNPGNINHSAGGVTAAYQGGGYGEQMFPACGKGFGGLKPISNSADIPTGRQRRERTNYYSVFGFVMNGVGGGRTGDENTRYFVTGTWNPTMATAAALAQMVAGDLAGGIARVADQVVGVVLANTRNEGQSQGNVPAIANGGISVNYENILCGFDKPVAPLINAVNITNATPENGNYYGQGRPTGLAGQMDAGSASVLGGLEGANCELVPGMCLCIGGCYRTTQSDGLDYTFETEFPLSWENFGQIEDIVHFTDRDPIAADIPAQGAATGDPDKQVSRLLISLREPHSIQRQPWNAFTSGTAPTVTFTANPIGGYMPRIKQGGGVDGGERTFACGIPKHGSFTVARINGVTQDPIIQRDGGSGEIGGVLPTIEIMNGCSLVNSSNPLGSDAACKGRLGIGLTSGGAYIFPTPLIEIPNAAAGGAAKDRWYFNPSFHRRLGGALLWEAVRCWTTLSYLQAEWNENSELGSICDAPEWGISEWDGIKNQANHGGIYPTYDDGNQNTTWSAGATKADALLGEQPEKGEVAKLRTLNLRDYKDNLPYIFVRPTYQGCQVTANGGELAPKLEAMTAFVVVEATESFEDVNELAAKFVEAFHSVNQLVAPTGDDIKKYLNQDAPPYNAKNNVVPYYSTGFFPASFGWNLAQLNNYTLGQTAADGYDPGAAGCWNKIAPCFQGNLVKVIPANLMVGIDWSEQGNSPYYYAPNDNKDYLKTGGADLNSNQVWFSSSATAHPQDAIDITDGTTTIISGVTGTAFAKNYISQLEVLPPSNRGVMWNNQIYGNLAYKDFRKAWAGDRFNRLDCCRMNYSGFICNATKPFSIAGANPNGQRDQDTSTGNAAGLPRIYNDVPRPIILNNQLKKKIVKAVDGWGIQAGVDADSQVQAASPFRGTYMRKNDVIMTNIYWTEENLDALQEIMRHNEKYDVASVYDKFGAKDAVDGFKNQNNQPTNWFYEMDIGMSDDSELGMGLQNGCPAGNPNITPAGSLVLPINSNTGFMVQTIQPKWANSYLQQTISHPVEVEATTTGLPPIVGSQENEQYKAYGCPYTAIPYGLAVEGLVGSGDVDGLNYGTGLFCYVGTTNCPTQALPYGQEPINFSPGWEGTPALPVKNEVGIDSNTFSSISPAQSCLGQGYAGDYSKAPGIGIIKVCSRWNELWETRPPYLNKHQPDSGNDASSPVTTGWDCGEPLPNAELYPEFEGAYPAGVIWNGLLGDDCDWAAIDPEIELGSGYGTQHAPIGNNHFQLNEMNLPSLKSLLQMAKDRNLGVVPYYYAGLDNNGATCVIQAEQPQINYKVGDVRPTDFPALANRADLTHPTSKKSLWYGRESGLARDEDNRPVMIGFVTHRAYEPMPNNISTWELGDIHYGDFFGWSNSFLDNPAVIPCNNDKPANQTEISVTAHPAVSPTIEKPRPAYCWNNINYIWVGANNANMTFDNDKQRFELSNLYTEQYLSNFNQPQPDASGNVGSDLPDAGQPVMVMNTELNDSYFHQIDFDPAKAGVSAASYIRTKCVCPPLWQSGFMTGNTNNNNATAFTPTNKGIQDSQSGVYLKDIWLPPKNWNPPPKINLQNYYDPTLVLENSSSPPTNQNERGWGHSSDEPSVWVDKTQQNYDEITADLIKASDTEWKGSLLDKMGFDYRQFIPYYGEQNNRFKHSTYSSTQTNEMNDGTKPLILNSNADTVINPAMNILGKFPDKYANGKVPPTSLNWQLGTPLYGLGFLNNDEVNIANVESGVITANRISTLFACPFYVVLSDICPTQFQSGSFKQECMFYGLKNYGAGQYFYVFGANYSQLVDTDRTITQIHTEIRNPLTGHLAKLSANSCILYKIERNISLPPVNVDVDGVWIGEEPPPKGEAFLPSVGLGVGGGGGHIQRAGAGGASGAMGKGGGLGLKQSDFMPVPTAEIADVYAVRMADLISGRYAGAGKDDWATREARQRLELKMAGLDPEGYLRGDSDAFYDTASAVTSTDIDTQEDMRDMRTLASSRLRDVDKERARILSEGTAEEKARVRQLVSHEKDRTVRIKRRLHDQYVAREAKLVYIDNEEGRKARRDHKKGIVLGKTRLKTKESRIRGKEGKAFRKHTTTLEQATDLSAHRKISRRSSSTQSHTQSSSVSSASTASDRPHTEKKKKSGGGRD